MKTTKKRIRRIVTGMICLLLMFTLTGCQIKIDIPGLGQIRLSVQRSLLRIYERVWMAHYSNLR